MSKLFNNSEKKHIPYASRRELAIACALGCLNIILGMIVSYFVNIDVAFVAVIFVIVYMIEIAVMQYKHVSVREEMPLYEIHDFLSEEGSVVFKNSADPVVVVDVHGTVLWYNTAMHMIKTQDENFVGMNISMMFDEKAESDIFSGEPVYIDGKIYSTESFVLSESKNGLYLLKLSDVTALSAFEKKYNDERVAVAYVAIDNVEDILQYVHEKFRDAISSVDD